MPCYEVARCEVCGRDDVELIADEDEIRREREEVWAFHARRLRADTPPTHLRDRVAFSERPPRRIVQCRHCGLVYRNPIERADEVTSRFAHEATPLDVLRALHVSQVEFARRQALRLRRIIGAGARVLEVGSYVGAFLAGAREAGLGAEGIDVSERTNAFVRSMGFAVHDGELTEFRSGRRFDAIAIWNTFDHLPDPHAVLAAARSRLKSNGLVAIRVPNGAAYARWRRFAGSTSAWKRRLATAILARNNLLAFPYRIGYSPSTTARLLGEAGFTIVQMRGDALVPLADQWTRPWARVEERITRRITELAVRRQPHAAPWFEAFARLSD
jgi:2-polyprenyl-3-methyl-5-hydroxy-6-metoxy-1,4-benzoquinol methylase